MNCTILAHAAANEQEPNMQISMMTYTMARGEWGKTLDVPELCRFCNELDINGIDWISIYGLDPKYIRNLTDDHGLKNICYTFFGGDMQSPDKALRKKAVDAADAELDIAETLGAKMVMVVLPGIPDIPKQESRPWCFESLNMLVEKAKPRGITVTTEHFSTSFTPFGTSEDMNIAVKEVPGLAIAYDNGNMFLHDEDPVQGYINSYKHVAHAHFKDWVVAETGLLSEDGKFYRGALVGEGVIDTAECLAAMSKYSYDGYINLEYEGDDYTPEQAMRKAVPYLQNMINGL